MAKKKEKKAGKRMKKSEMSERLISLFHTKPNETFSRKRTLQTKRPRPDYDWRLSA